MISLVLADAQLLFRQGLCSLLADSPDISISGQAGDGNECLQVVEQVTPDIAVLEIALPGLSGIETARRIRSLSNSSTTPLILTDSMDSFYTVEALKAGARGYVLKQEGIDAFIEAIRSVASGEIHISATLETPVLKKFIALARDSEQFERNILTVREQEVLRLVADGLTNQKIAEVLCISASTVDTHRKNIMAKLDIHSVAGLVKYAIRHQIVLP